MSPGEEVAKNPAGSVRASWSWLVALASLSFVVVAALSAKTGADLVAYRRQFPAWFVPTFIVGLVGVLGYTGYTVIAMWRSVEALRPIRNGISIVIWVLLALSFVCTTAVHQFYPFRLDTLRVWSLLHPVLRLNLAMALLGLLLTAALGIAYHRGRPRIGIIGLLVLGAFLLTPNDNCANPFNHWWIGIVGASPLMFIPNVIAAILGVGALLGIHPRVNSLGVMAICMSTALLGLGHMARVIW